MKKIIQLTILILGFAFCTSCGFQVDCPDFDTQLLDWVPYQNNDVIELQNSTNDSVITFVVNRAFVQHTTHYKTNLKCGTCDDRITINGEDVNNTNLEINIGLNENDISDQNFIINGSYFFDYNSDYSEQTNYSYNGVKYDAVRIFANTETSQEFKKLIIAKGFGIIGLVDTAGNNWILKAKSIKNGKSGIMEIENISCG